MTLRRFDLRSPAQLIAQVADEVPLTADTELMQELAIPEGPAPPRHSALTVVVRRGLCVFGPNEGNWLSAWKYSNHLTNAFTGGVLLVTEHGWADFMTDEAGRSPATAA